MTEERKKLLFEIAREAGLDLGFIYGLPMLKRAFTGRAATAEDKAVVAEARQLVSEGKHDEARKLLVRHMMGLGLYDEQMFDEDLDAVVRAGLCTKAQVKSLGEWLAKNQRRRSKFRNSLTLQETPQKRLEVIAVYAKLKTDAERNARLKAVGKLDDQMDEAVWNWVKTHVPGISRKVWDGIVTASGDTNQQLNNWGRRLQRGARWGFPAPARRPAPTKRTIWQWFVDFHR